MTIEVKLTPTKQEQLAYIQKYDHALFEGERPLEEIATELLYDSIRAKYNYLKEKHEGE